MNNYLHKSDDDYFDKKIYINHASHLASLGLERQAVGKHGEKQIIATNIDVGFIVQAINRDFSINRLERYLTICHTSKVTPVIVLTKIDLISKTELENFIDTISARINNTTILPISNTTSEGIDILKSYIKQGQTYCSV